MSDNKKLLNESTIRRFQKLASIPSVNINETDEEEVNEAAEEEVNEAAEEELDEAHCGTRDEDEEDVKKENNEAEELEEAEEEVEEGYGMHSGERDDDEEADMEDDMEGGMEGGMEDEDVSLSDEEAQLLISLGQKLAAAMGDDDEADDDMEMPMDDEEGDDAAELPPMEEGEDVDDLVNEIYKRVAKRIVAEKLKNK